MRPRGPCQATVRPRAAAGRAGRSPSLSKVGPPAREQTGSPRQVGTGTPASYTGPCPVAPFAVAVQGASDAWRWEKGGARGWRWPESRRDSRAAHRPLLPAPEPESRERWPRWHLPQAAGVILTPVVHLLHDTGAPAPRAPPRCPELRSARPACAADFCVSLCSHRFRQEPGPRPRHLTGPLMLELPR